jgi:hypothetical protein
MPSGPLFSSGVSAYKFHNKFVFHGHLSTLTELLNQTIIFNKIFNKNVFVSTNFVFLYTTSRSIVHFRPRLYCNSCNFARCMYAMLMYRQVSTGNLCAKIFNFVLA